VVAAGAEVDGAEGARAEGGAGVGGGAAADARGEAEAGEEAAHGGGGRGAVVVGVTGRDAHRARGDDGQVIKRRDRRVAAHFGVKRGRQDDEAAGACHGAQGVDVDDLGEGEDGPGFAGDGLLNREGATGGAGGVKGVERGDEEIVELAVCFVGPASDATNVGPIEEGCWIIVLKLRLVSPRFRKFICIFDETFVFLEFEDVTTTLGSPESP
jgi:hypothetical protein